MNRLTRRELCALLPAAPLAAQEREEPRTVRLVLRPALIALEVAGTSYRFTKSGIGWAFDGVWVRGRKTAVPLSRGDSFFLGGGEAQSFSVVADSALRKEVRFNGIGGANATYSVDTTYLLPAISIRLTGVEMPTCAWRTVEASADQSGAWATRGETAADAEGREVFVDASGRLVFGHSRAGSVDVAYVIQAKLLDNISHRGKSMQPSDTFFKSARIAERDEFYGCWQIRMGQAQPKEFGIVFDRDLGSRLHDVCERYYADAVDSQVDLASIPFTYDPYLAVERMPLRLSCPESLIPQYGWHMEEYFPGYAKAAYPFGEDSGIQTAAFLAFEGHATRRDWEKYFGQYVMDQLPLWGTADGTGFFTQRRGGWTRWAYNTDYVTKFPLMEGGNWSDAEHLYRTATLLGDAELKQKALGLMRHDVEVKLDLENMWFPPCWNPVKGRLEDHRDDWETTSGLAYCAEVSSQILLAETGDTKYLAVANRITNWLASHWGPETRMNWLHPKVNTFHCFMGPLVRALVHRYERDGDAKFLDIAKDLTWVMILTLCVTPHKDLKGQSFTGVTCVGVRGCVDFDCAPNLCHEKDLAFLEIMGAVLPYVRGTGYGKFLAMQKLVLPRDSWNQAFHVQEQRDLNLRTNYDNYARGMANLAFGLNRGSNPFVSVYERSVPVRNPRIDVERHIVLANATRARQTTNVEVRFLQPGKYRVELDRRPAGVRRAEELSRGLEVSIEGNSTCELRVFQIEVQKASREPPQYDASITYLSDLPEMAAQRGIGLPTPIFQRDQSFRGNPIRIANQLFSKGLGLAANTVIIYKLNRQYHTLSGIFGIAGDAARTQGPKPSVYFTVFADGLSKFVSGPTYAETGPHRVEVDVRNAGVLVLRMSGNWDDNGNLENDMACFANARLTGKALS